MEKKPRGARRFYAVLAAAMVGGLAIDFLGLDAVKVMFWSAVLNGALAPPLILLVILLTSNRRVMGVRASSNWLRILGWVTFVLMSSATGEPLDSGSNFPGFGLADCLGKIGTPGAGGIALFDRTVSQIQFLIRAAQSRGRLRYFQE